MFVWCQGVGKEEEGNNSNKIKPPSREGERGIRRQTQGGGRGELKRSRRRAAVLAGV